MPRDVLRKALRMVLVALAALQGTALSQEQAQGVNDSAAAGNHPEESEKKSAVTKLHIVVTAGEPAAPVHAAHVEVTSEEDRVAYNTTKETDQKGVVDLDVPRGNVLIQVIAQHWENSGARCRLRKETETVEIKLVKRNTPPVAAIMTCEVLQ